MTNKLDPNTPNIETGVFISRSEPIDFVATDVQLPVMATYLKSVSGGTLIWKNTHTGITGSWDCEAGEMFSGRFNQILASATVGGIAETTTAGRYYWGETASDLN